MCHKDSITRNKLNRLLIQLPLKKSLICRNDIYQELQQTRHILTGKLGLKQIEIRKRVSM